MNTEADMNWFSATTESADECKDDRLPASFCITDYKVNVYIKSSYWSSEFVGVVCRLKNDS